MTALDHRITAAMQRQGGSFVFALAIAAKAADAANLERLKAAFADLWKAYEIVSQADAEIERKATAQVKGAE